MYVPTCAACFGAASMPETPPTAGHRSPGQSPSQRPLSPPALLFWPHAPSTAAALARPPRLPGWPRALSCRRSTCSTGGRRLMPALWASPAAQECGAHGVRTHTDAACSVCIHSRPSRGRTRLDGQPPRVYERPREVRHRVLRLLRRLEAHKRDLAAPAVTAQVRRTRRPPWSERVVHVYALRAEQLLHPRTWCAALWRPSPRRARRSGLAGVRRPRPAAGS